MRIGTSLTTGLDTGDARRSARHLVEWARAAHAAELDSLFVGDYHSLGIPYFQNSPVLGRLLAEWGGRPAGALYVLPLWHPVLLAEQVGTLATIADGPFVVIAALGKGGAPFDALGVDPHERVARFEASLDILRRLLAGEEVVRTVPWKFRAAPIAPLPPEPVQIWVAAMAAPAIERAARVGDGWIARPGISLDDARDQATHYLEMCAKLDRVPGPVAIRRDIHVGDDDRGAERTAQSVLADGYRANSPVVPVVGGVERVAEKLREFATLGYTDVIVRQLAADHTDVLASFERLRAVRELVADA
jgi:alkanesulfonate monooxygenase SsuD/methylene tetrahydromethanopterin reductase-like flavin-dependent oxidoreductase (luciferase family)